MLFNTQFNLNVSQSRLFQHGIQSLIKDNSFFVVFYLIDPLSSDDNFFLQTVLLLRVASHFSQFSSNHIVVVTVPVKLSVTFRKTVPTIWLAALRSDLQLFPLRQPPTHAHPLTAHLHASWPHMPPTPYACQRVWRPIPSISQPTYSPPPFQIRPPFYFLTHEKLSSIANNPDFTLFFLLSRPWETLTLVSLIRLPKFRLSHQKI